MAWKLKYRCKTCPKCQGEMEDTGEKEFGE